MKREAWVSVYGLAVYVDEKGRVTRGLKRDINGELVTAYPYTPSKDGGYDLNQYLSLSAFRGRVRRGTVTMQ